MIPTVIFVGLSVLCVWIFRNNIEIVILLVGTIGANCLAWFFPGVLYLMNLYRLKSWNKYKVGSALFFNIMFMVVLISGMIIIF